MYLSPLMSGVSGVSMKNGGARQATLRSLDSAVSSLLALISREYAQLVQHTTGFIRRAHQNASGSVVSELMRFIHHIITYMYIAPATCTCSWDGSACILYMFFISFM